MNGISIKALSSLAEMQAAVELQKVFWPDTDELVPAHMLFSLAKYGGHVLAALDGEQVVGVVIGLLGTNIEDSDRPAMANLLILSKRLVVLPDYRGRGIGYKLKLAQRDFAIKQGVRLVTWTFDPLIAANAYLNIRKLGVVCQEFAINRFGTEGFLTSLGTSDRLIVDWWVTNRRVKERINGDRHDLLLRQYLEANTRIVNPSQNDSDDNPVPASVLETTAGSLALLEIPVHFDRIKQHDKRLAMKWQLHIRELLKVLFAEGFVVTDFLREQYERRDRAFYVLSRNVRFDYRWN